MKSLLFSIIGVPSILSSSVVLKKQIDGEWGLLTNESVSEQQQKNLPDIKNLLQHDEQLKKTAAKLPPAQQRDFRKIRNSFLNQKDGSIGELTAKQIPQDIWNHAASIGIDKSNIKHYADNIADDNLEPMIQALSADKQLSPIQQKQLVQHMKQLKKNTKEELENQIIQAEQKQKEYVSKLEQLQKQKDKEQKQKDKEQKQKEEEQKQKETAEKLKQELLKEEKRKEDERIKQIQKQQEREALERLAQSQRQANEARRQKEQQETARKQRIYTQMNKLKTEMKNPYYAYSGSDADIQKIEAELLKNGCNKPKASNDEWKHIDSQYWMAHESYGFTRQTYGCFAEHISNTDHFSRLINPTDPLSLSQAMKIYSY